MKKPDGIVTYDVGLSVKHRATKQILVCEIRFFLTEKLRRVNNKLPL